MSYAIEFTPRAEGELDDLPQTVRPAIGRAIAALAGDPRPLGVVPLRTVLRGSYRLRVGEYRVGYQVDDRARVVTVWQVGHRQRFYQKAKRRRR